MEFELVGLVKVEDKGGFSELSDQVFRVCIFEVQGTLGMFRAVKGRLRVGLGCV